jgi:hypothetical protein
MKKDHTDTPREQSYKINPDFCKCYFITRDTRRASSEICKKIILILDMRIALEIFKRRTLCNSFAQMYFQKISLEQLGHRLLASSCPMSPFAVEIEEMRICNTKTILSG